MIWAIGAILFAISMIEMTTVITVANSIGIFPTVLLMFFSVIMGIYLIRLAGVATVQRVIMDLQQGRMPGQTLLDGVCYFLAGVMLLVPGFCTDIIAVLLLIPFTRIWIQRLVIYLFLKRMRRY